MPCAASPASFLIDHTTPHHTSLPLTTTNTLPYLTHTHSRVVAVADKCRKVGGRGQSHRGTSSSKTCCCLHSPVSLSLSLFLLLLLRVLWTYDGDTTTRPRPARCHARPHMRSLETRVESTRGLVWHGVARRGKARWKWKCESGSAQAQRDSSSDLHRQEDLLLAAACCCCWCKGWRGLQWSKALLLRPRGAHFCPCLQFEQSLPCAPVSNRCSDG